VVSFTPQPRYPGERAPGNHWIGVWVGPRVDLDGVEKRKFLTLLGLELRTLCLQARSQSLYRLHYPGSSSYIKLNVLSFLRPSCWFVLNKTYLTKRCTFFEDLLQYPISGLFMTLMSRPYLKFACRHDGNIYVKKLKCYVVWWHKFNIPIHTLR
jgi:hypothetical protein